MTTRPQPDSPKSPGPSSSDPARRSLRARRALFVLISLVCALATVIYVRKAVTRERSTQRSVERSLTTEPLQGSRWARTAGPLILFSNLASAGGLRYRAALAPIAAPEGSRALTSLACERLYFAGGHGLCLGDGGGMAPLEDGVMSTHAYFFGSDFHITRDIPLGGIPSRVRVSPDGRYGAVTVFVVGHSYADAGFSTATTLIDLDSGRTLGNLEKFAVSRDGRRFQSIDFNFWGVTFAPDSDRFYASLGSRGRTYLVEGSVSARRMQVLRENVECPSASPDGSRLAFKRPGGKGEPRWRLHVLDLATLKETALAERRSIDDQIEWLDDRQVLYGEAGSIWAVDADGGGAPRKFLSQATSPAVLRGEGLAGAASSVATTGLTLPVADLAVRLESSAGAIEVGGETRYTVTVTNNGPADASMLKLDQLLAPGLTPVGPFTVTNPGQSYGCSHHDDPTHLSCDTDTLRRGGVWTVSFTVRARATGAQNVQVIVNGAETDPDSGNDRAEIRTTVRPEG